MIPAGYRSRSDVLDVVARHGGTVIGRSVYGAPIAAALLGNPQATCVSIAIGGLHAIEWIGVEVALALLVRLAAAPPSDRLVIVVPLANPDGYRAIEDDLRLGRRKFRRTNANGVDLNRNWPTGFVPRPRWLARFNFPGGQPCSEPEVAAIVGALDREVARGATIDSALSLHSFGRKLLIPYGSRWRRSPRHHQLMRRAEGVRARMSERYSITQISRWLPGAFAFGVELDDLHERYGADALLVECAFGGVSRDPASWITPFWWYNPREPARIADEIARAVDPFVRGD